MPGEVCITTPYAHRADRCKHCMYRSITDRQLVRPGDQPVSTPLIRSDSLYFMQFHRRGQLPIGESRQPPTPVKVTTVGQSPIVANLAGIGGSYGALSAPHSDASAPYGVPRTH